MILKICILGLALLASRVEANDSAEEARPADSFSDTLLEKLMRQLFDDFANKEGKLGPKRLIAFLNKRVRHMSQDEMDAILQAFTNEDGKSYLQIHFPEFLEMMKHGLVDILGKQMADEKDFIYKWLMVRMSDDIHQLLKMLNIGWYSIDPEGRNALKSAIRYGNSDMVKLLLENGAAANSSDNGPYDDETSPLEYARKILQKIPPGNTQMLSILGLLERHSDTE